MNKKVVVTSKLLTILCHDVTPILTHIVHDTRRLKQTHPSDHSLNGELENVAYTINELISNIGLFLLWNEFHQPGFEMSPSHQGVFSLTESVIRVYRGVAKKKGLKIHNRTDKELLIKIDPVLLRIILSNLVANALKNTTTGGLIISSYVESSRITIHVEDSGTGMTEKQVRDLYAVLQSSHPGFESQYAYKPEGLGYQIIAEMIKLASGQIVIRSSPGEGTTISVSFSE